MKQKTTRQVERLKQKVRIWKPDNIIVDKQKLLIRKAFGIALSGLKENAILLPIFIWILTICLKVMKK